MQLESGAADGRQEIDDAAGVDAALVGQGPGQRYVAHNGASSQIAIVFPGNVFI
ncbi:hypothetical protein D3C76_1485550 [compost metagenome]